MSEHACRPNCGACCIAVSISSPIPGMPEGKPAGVRCIHLNENRLCNLYGKPERPQVCVDFQFSEAFCGSNREEAYDNYIALEQLTRQLSDSYEK